jgi:feruloyl esterase
MHCAGGAGPDSFNSAFAGVPPPPEPGPDNDLFHALTAWREQGRPPARVIATRFESADPKRIAFLRPLCAWPRQAIYTGRGSTASAANFQCWMRPPPSR